MGYYSDKRMPKPSQDQLWIEFCDLVVGLKSREAVRRFFCDLMNRTERLMFIRRLQIASLLEAGATYEQIKKTLGVGATTIARVHRWLEFGRGGYRSAVQRLPERDRRGLQRKYLTYYGRRKKLS